MRTKLLALLLNAPLGACAAPATAAPTLAPATSPAPTPAAPAVAPTHRSPAVAPVPKAQYAFLKNDYCTGWYIRNKNPKPRTLTLYPGAPIRLNGKTVDLRTFLRDVRPGCLIKFTIDGWRMMSLEFIYLP
jgi:hypothetical protein